ncbi:MAG: UDP-N-acetylglucosamine 4,6-dehydratase family protein [Candidatus Aenigmatarchaeota archaeon]
MIELKNTFNGKDILVTGGCGFIGRELVKQLLKFDVKRVRIYDNNESMLYYFQQELKDYKTVRYFIGDVRDSNRLKRAMKGVDIVFHAAALKHVPLCEYNPSEAIKTNVFGTQNVVEVADEENVEKVIFISTDKAVNPINTMGATKLLSEKVVLNANVGGSKTKFSCVRFGNVLDSTGSVIPIFREQIRKGEAVTLTSEKMIRFFMPVSDAIKLVLKACTIMEGKEIFIIKMKSLKIKDLAEVMVEELSPNKPIAIQIIGIRPGEKLYEVLITDEEANYVEDIDDMFIIKATVIAPHLIITPNNVNKITKNNYDVRQAMLLTKDEIRNILKKEGII